MEYEYSFKVNDYSQYINYCVSNNYSNLGTYKQKRIIYRNKKGLIGRITISNDSLFLDFKEDNLFNNDLSIRKESLPIKIDNISNCENILNFLGFNKDNTLIRERYIYSKDNVKFEIDNYFETNEFVISIEGIKNNVDKVYNDLENSLNILYKI